MLQTLTRPARFAAAAVLPFVLTASTPTAGTSLSDGATYDFTVRSQTTQSGNKESVVMQGRGWFSGDNAKIEIVGASSGEGMFGGKGSYFLMLDGGQKMLLVDPENKAYIEWDMQAMLAGMTKMMGALGSLVKMEMTEFKAEAQKVGAGPTIHGYSTQHVRIVESYSMNARVMGRSSSSRVETMTDYYLAPDLKIANPFVQNGNMFASAMDMFNNPEYKRQMVAAQAALAGGVPIKTVARSVTTDANGKQETSVVTTEMTNFTRADLPAATFAIPSGYQAMQMPTFDADMDGELGADVPDVGSLLEAAKEGAAEGAKEGVKEGTKDATKEAVGRKIRGIIKK